MATYDKAKHWLLAHTSLKDDAVTHGISSAGAGLAAAIASTPADVVKTRIMNQPYDKSGRFVPIRLFVFFKNIFIDQSILF